MENLSCSATVNGQLTMVPKDVKYTQTLGSPFISFNELLMINVHYECTSKLAAMQLFYIAATDLYI